MADYNGLAELRGALTDDDPNRRGDAYGAVYTHGLEPADLLSDNPDDESVERLREAGVLPDNSDENAIGPAEFRKRVVAALEETGGEY